MGNRRQKTEGRVFEFGIRNSEKKMEEKALHRLKAQSKWGWRRILMAK